MLLILMLLICASFKSFLMEPEITRDKKYILKNIPSTEKIHEAVRKQQRKPYNGHICMCIFCESFNLLSQSYSGRRRKLCARNMTVSCWTMSACGEQAAHQMCIAAVWCLKRCSVEVMPTRSMTLWTLKVR